MPDRLFADRVDEVESRMEEEGPRDRDLKDVLEEEKSRGRRPVDTGARRAQRQREEEQAEDEELILRVIQERDREKLVKRASRFGLARLSD